MADIEGYNIEDLASLPALQLTDLLVGARGSASYKLLVSDIAKAIVENYKGSSLAGSAQSVKSALDSLNSSCIGGRVIRYSVKNINVPTNIPGQRVFQIELPLTTGAGEYISGYMIVYNSDSNKMNPMIFYASNHLYLNIYGASSSAVSNGSVTVRLLILKKITQTDVNIDASAS